MSSTPEGTATGPAIALVVRRMIRARPARVFEAWTRPEQLRLWWGPAGVTCPVAEVDLRVGGRYRIGNRLPTGETVWISGIFEAIDAPRRLVYSWSTREDGLSTERVTVRFEPVDDGTEVIVVHAHIPDPPTRESHAAGWAGCLDGLDALFAGR